MHTRLTTIVALAALTLAPVLTGCATTTAPKAQESSLMERFHSGQNLIGDAAGAGDPTGSARQHYQRGASYEAQGRQELAFEQFSRAAQLDPTLIQARERRGEILLDQGLLDDALAEFQSVLETMPDYAPAHEAAGLVYFRSNLYPEAEQFLSKAVALDPTRVRALVHLGAIHNYRKDFPKAVLAFQAALLAAPDDGTIYNNLGLTFSMMGDDGKAVEAFGTALRLGAPSAKAYNNMGLALARLGRDAEALEAFRCAEGEAAAYNNLGYFYFMEGRYPQAVASFQRAIALEPTYYARAHENLKRARLALSFEDAGAGRPAHAALRGGIPALDGAAVAAVPTGPLAKAAGTGFGPALIQADPAPGTPAAPAPRWLTNAPRIPASAPASPPSVDLPDIRTASAASGLVTAPAETATRIAQTAPPKRFQAPAPVDDTPLYTLHFSSWRQRFNALREAERLRNKGHEVSVIPVTLKSSGQWWRVAIGSYNTLEDARKALGELQSRKGYADVRVVRRTRTAPAAEARNL